MAYLNNAVVWMVSTRPIISKSSSLRTNGLVTVPSAPNTNRITRTFMLLLLLLFVVVLVVEINLRLS